MSQEIARISLPHSDALILLANLMVALQDKGLLDGGVISEKEQRVYLLGIGLSSAAHEFLRGLDDEMPATFFVEGLEKLRNATAVDEEGDFYLYFRLQTPGRLSADTKSLYVNAFGKAPDELPALMMTHPYEFWVHLDLANPQTDHLELLTLPDNLAYLELALAWSGAELPAPVIDTLPI